MQKILKRLNLILIVLLILALVPIRATVVYASPTVIQTTRNNYRITYDTGDTITIGNGTGTFNSAFNISRWNECFISLSLSNAVTGNLGNGNLNANTKTISFSNSNFAFAYSPTEIKQGFNDSGGFDFAIILKRKPAINALTFNYNNTLVNAYPQLPLTSEYTTGWNDEFQCSVTVTETDVIRDSDGEVLVHRPEWLVNGIVFYHRNQMNFFKPHPDAVKYKAGRIGALYRMKAVDALGNWAYFNWSLVGNQIIGTIDQTFLNTATYPVTIQPIGDTFGYDGGAGTSGTIEDALEGNQFTCPSAGTGNFIRAYISGTGTTQKYKFAIYNTATPNAIITNGGTNEGTYNAGAGYYQQNFTSAPTLANQEYRLYGWGSSATGTCRMNYDATTLTRYYLASTYGAWASFTPETYANQTLTIWCDYTPSTPPGAEVDPTSWAAGVLAVNTTANTAINYFTVTNTGGGTIDIAIKGTDATGGGDTWTLSDTGTPGANTFGIYAGLDDADDNFDIIIKKTAAYNYLVENLIEDATQDWGIKLYMPTSVSNYEGQTMTSTVTLIVSAS